MNADAVLEKLLTDVSEFFDVTTDTVRKDNKIRLKAEIVVAGQPVISSRYAVTSLC